VSLRDTDTVQVTGVGFDAVIVRMRTGMDFQYVSPSSYAIYTKKFFK